jgi:hypothetical protein
MSKITSDSIDMEKPDWLTQMETVLQALNEGVIIADDRHRVLFANSRLYDPGTRHHIKNVLKAGATLEEIMEVLKLCVVQGVQACNLCVPILAEEMERKAASQNSRA